MRILFQYILYFSFLATGIAQDIVLPSEFYVEYNGSYNLPDNKKLVFYNEYLVPVYTTKPKSGVIKFGYFDESGILVDSFSSFGFVNDSFSNHRLSSGILKNNKIYFTHELQNLYDKENIRINVCSFDPQSKKLELIKSLDFNFPNFYFTFTTGYTSDSSDYILFKTTIRINPSGSYFKNIILNVGTNKVIVSKKILRTVIIKKDYFYNFQVNSIEKYFPENDSSSLYKYLDGQLFLTDAYGQEFEDKFYFSSLQVNSQTGWGLKLCMVDKEGMKSKCTVIDQIESSCMLPTSYNTDIKFVNNKLFLAFTLVDNRLCPYPELVVAPDSPPNKYGLIAFTPELQICDTLIFDSPDYRLALRENIVNDSIIAIGGNIFNILPYSSNSFVHFINVNSACSTSANKDLQVSAEIKVYPVPASNILSVEIPSHIIFDQLEIVDVLGRSVKKIDYKYQNIHIEDLTSGIYLIKISYNNKMIASRKFIKI
ncbi:MAG: T9SS type A sorting domain-containing protein [Saprospiraceae bacterium]|nr:T9SS type A sorting domain-containing protein [Saprospiraceae bacterium]